jgi:phosphate transport system substrate-binding protein
MLKRIFTPYAMLSFILAAILPLLAITVIPFITPNLGWFSPLYLVLPALWAVITLLAGVRCAAKAPLPDTLFARLLPLLLPPLLLLLAYMPSGPVGGPISFIPLLDKALTPFLREPILLALGSTTWCCFTVAFLIRSESRRPSAGKMRGAISLLGLLLMSAGATAAVHHVATRDIFVLRGVNGWDYRPFDKDNKLALPASSPSVRIASEHPRLHGLLEIFPLYAAFAQAVYTQLYPVGARRFVRYDIDEMPYRLLIDGEVDIIFGTPPTQKQREYAASKGLSLTETLIGKEALVFLTHKDNPVAALTQAQIRAVYSGRIGNWKELGGTDETILTFEWPYYNSRSRTVMTRIMEGEAISSRVRGRPFGGRVVLGPDAYRNRQNDLGYAPRWYATVPYPSPYIRLLAIDGIAPTPANIQSGAYPFIMPLLAVTARPLSPQSTTLLDWILGPEGQALLERVGYVPLRQGSAVP